MSYGEYRSAREAGDWSGAWAAAKNLEEGLKQNAILDWWKNADLKEVAEDLVWSYKKQEHPILECIDEEKWKCTLGGVKFTKPKNLDLQPLQKKWAIVPALEVIHIWEDWAAINLPDSVNVARNLLDLIDQDVDPEKRSDVIQAFYGLQKTEPPARYSASYNRFLQNQLRRDAIAAEMNAHQAATASFSAAVDEDLAAQESAVAAARAKSGINSIGICDHYGRYNDMFSLYVLEHLKDLQLVNASLEFVSQ